jgi:hypothetical protein
MTRTRAVLTALIVFASVSAAYASGPLNIYALIERVVFEAPPDAPSAIRVYGAFTFVDERLASNTSPLTGYLYFRLNPERDPHDFRLLPDAREMAGSRANGGDRRGRRVRRLQLRRQLRPAPDRCVSQTDDEPERAP